MNGFTLLVGKIYMNNGVIIPFASLKRGENGGLSFERTWDERGHRITAVTNTNFVLYKDIPQINHIDYASIMAIVTEKEIEMNEREAFHHWPELQELK